MSPRGKVRDRGATSRLDPGSAEARIGVAWRELRRGAAMQAMRERLYGELLDPSQVDALDVVVAEGACRMRRLAEVLRIDASTATRTVDRLERAGLVARGAADGDGRAVLVRPTAAGRALHARLNARRRAMLLEVLSGFDAAEREQLAGLLERLVAGVDRYARG